MPTSSALRALFVATILTASVSATAVGGADVASASTAEPTATFGQTGTEQSFVVPDGITTLHVVLIGGHGASGAHVWFTLAPPSPGGAGAVVEADLAVSPGEELYLDVGGNGDLSQGGYNGGADAGGDTGGGGGGSTDIRLIPRDQPGSLASRILVAAGGGGGGADVLGAGGAGDAAGSGGARTWCISGGGGGAGTVDGPGAGGAAGTQGPYQSGSGADGVAGAGGVGGWGALPGGGGGGGYYGGGGGGGSESAGGCYGGGGGGGGASYADSTRVSNVSVSTDASGEPRALFGMRPFGTAVTPDALPASTVTSTPTGDYLPVGTNVSVSAAALVPDGGRRYVFSHWAAVPASSVQSGCGTDPTDCTVVVDDTATSVTAVYTTQYQLTLSSNAPVGTAQIEADPASTDGFYDAGTSVDISADTAITIDGASYPFAQWLGDVDQPSTSATTTVTMDRARSIVAGYPGPRTVCASGCDSTTIADALDRALDDGSIIRVLDPVHTEWNVDVSKNVTIEGLGANLTTIDADHQGRAFTIESNAAVTIRDLTVTNGKSDLGGAIRNYGQLTLTRVVLSGNEASSYGGGFMANGPMTMTASTVTGNHALISGGGGYMMSPAAITNSTIAGNTADGDGAGLISNDTLTLTNDTVTGNASPNHPDDPTGAVTYFWVGSVSNSVIAGNLGEADLCADSCGYGVAVDANSIIGVPAGLTLADVLDPAGLADHGGPTPTIALTDSATNPAVGGGDDATCAAAPVSGVDQRGYARPASGCDVGAYELGAVPSGAPSDQTIAFTSTPPSAPTVGTTYTPAATATSGLPVSFSIDGASTPGACWLSGGVVRLIGPGRCVVDADQAGDADYAPAATAQATLDIGYTRTLSGSVASVSVASGEAVLLAPGTVVKGSVSVAAGGALSVQGATLNGSLSASGATAVRLCGSTFKAPVGVTGTQQVVVAGDVDGAATCAGNAFAASVSLTGNLGGIDFEGNTVKGQLTITGNTGTLPPPDTGTVDVSMNRTTGKVRIQS